MQYQALNASSPLQTHRMHITFCSTAMPPLTNVTDKRTPSTQIKSPVSLTMQPECLENIIYFGAYPVMQFTNECRFVVKITLRIRAITHHLGTDHGTVFDCHSSTICPPRMCQHDHYPVVVGLSQCDPWMYVNQLFRSLSTS